MAGLVLDARRQILNLEQKSDDGATLANSLLDLLLDLVVLCQLFLVLLLFLPVLVGRSALLSLHFLDLEVVLLFVQDRYV